MRAVSSLLAAAGCSSDPPSTEMGEQGASGVNAAGTSGIGAAGDGANSVAGAAGSGTASTAGAGGRGVAGAGAGAGTGGAVGSAGTAGRATAAGSGGSSGSGAGGTGGSTAGAGATSAMMNFFVASTTSTTANLEGLTGADARCQTLAAGVGLGGKTWRAYLSAENPPTNAADRIGAGPYYNALGMMIAADKAALHARAGDAALFLTEQGARVNGQWSGSPTPNQHDILTGTQRDGTLAAGLTCGDWTATTGNSQVGHSDGLGPNQGTSGALSYWNSTHTGMCGNTMPGGGAGRIYCFVAP